MSTIRAATASSSSSHIMRRDDAYDEWIRLPKISKVIECDPADPPHILLLSFLHAVCIPTTVCCILIDYISFFHSNE